MNTNKILGFNFFKFIQWRRTSRSSRYQRSARSVWIHKWIGTMSSVSTWSQRSAWSQGVTWNAGFCFKSSYFLFKSHNPSVLGSCRITREAGTYWKTWKDRNPRLSRFTWCPRWWGSWGSSGTFRNGRSCLPTWFSRYRISCHVFFYQKHKKPI